MNICLIEPFHTGSHANWAEEYARCSRHHVELLTMSGRRWKWRMHGGAVTLARQFLERRIDTDLLLASDMLDLTTFLALTRNKTAGLPSAIYFHENQLTYPWITDKQEAAQQRAHYAFINYTSALAADAVLFNSRYHLDSFNGELRVFLKSFPDQNELASLDLLKRKSEVLPLGLDLRRFDAYQGKTERDPAKGPLILWNHRWEYDKNPEDFFRALYQLKAEGLAFQVALLGESYRNSPAIFAEAQQHLGERIIHVGYAADFADYASWLWRADLLPVCSHHDFFGVSVVQAIYCQCIPLLPHRLAYPEHLPQQFHAQLLYDSCEDFLLRLRSLIQSPLQPCPELRARVAGYDWQEMVNRYDDRFEMLLADHRNSGRQVLH